MPKRSKSSRWPRSLKSGLRLILDGYNRLYRLKAGLRKPARYGSVLVGQKKNTHPYTIITLLRLARMKRVLQQRFIGRNKKHFTRPEKPNMGCISCEPASK